MTLGRFSLRNWGSAWASVTAVVVAAVNAQPSFTALVSMGLMALFVLVARWLARLEGRSERP